MFCKKCMYIDLFFKEHMQVFFGPSFHLYALEMKREKGLNIIEFIKLQQVVVCETLSFSEEQFFLVFGGNLQFIQASFIFYISVFEASRSLNSNMSGLMLDIYFHRLFPL